MITYRINKTNTLHAAYSGACRVGYVEVRISFTAPAAGWRWQLILLRPEGGAYWGFTDTENEAKTMLEESFANWTIEARLQPKEKTNGHRDNQEELSSDNRRDKGGGKRDTTGEDGTGRRAGARGASGDRPAPKRRRAGANREASNTSPVKR